MVVYFLVLGLSLETAIWNRGDSLPLSLSLHSDSIAVFLFHSQLFFHILCGLLLPRQGFSFSFSVSLQAACWDKKVGVPIRIGPDYRHGSHIQLWAETFSSANIFCAFLSLPSCSHVEEGWVSSSPVERLIFCSLSPPSLLVFSSCKERRPGAPVNMSFWFLLGHLCSETKQHWDSSTSLIVAGYICKSVF